MSSNRLLVLVGVAAILWLGSGARADEIKTLGGKSVTGTVTGVSATEVEVRTKDGMVKVPLAQVLAVDLRPSKGVAGVKYSEVRLVDNTVLKASKVVFTEKGLELTLTSGQVIETPMEAVTAIIHDPEEAAHKKRWAEILRDRVREDRIVMLSKGALGAVTGSFGEVLLKEGKIKFTQSDGTKREVDLTLPRGFLFLRVELPKDEPLCRVVDVAGNAVTALKLGYDGKEYTVTTMFKTKLALKADLVAKLDFNFGKLTFLSDLEPAKVVEKSGAGLVTKYRRDKNLDDVAPILLGAKEYSKGLSMQAYTELEYDLGGKYLEFKALAGVDTRVGAESQAVLKIYCDGVLQLEYTVTAKEVRPIALNVKDAQTLRIVVSSKNFLDLYDHATLAEARVSQ
jgi:hypothetical protein